MKLQPSFVLLLLMSFLSIAATTEKVLPLPAPTATEAPIIYPAATEQVQQKKMNFFQRMLFKMAVRKFRKAEDSGKADRQGTAALIFGSVALASLILAFVVPSLVLFFAAIPTGIIAMVLGKEAVKGGTKDPAKAKIGKAFGLVSLILLATLTIIAAIAVSNWNW